jgi:erythromycin esterase-like protein
MGQIYSEMPGDRGSGDRMPAIRTLGRERSCATNSVGSAIAVFVVMPVEDVRRSAYALQGNDSDYRLVLDLVGDASLVLLGEASHGTHDFYETRAEITKRLITEKGFSAVAVEADWPDAYRVNRYVRGRGDDTDANSALRGFERFPTWMWRNTVVLQFVEWLRDFNSALPEPRKAGFFGLDLYSLFNSIGAVLEYLDRVDPEAASRARYRYSCFEHFGEDSQAYGYVASFDLSRSCEDEAIHQLIELQRRALEYSSSGDGEDFFEAEQNARLVKNAEEY